MGNVYMEADQVRFKNSTYHNLQTAVSAALEGGGGGGTTVVANPEGSATTDLAKLQVGTTIYGIPAEAGDISYDNTSSGMTADDVQEAIDELSTGISGITGLIPSDATSSNKLATADDIPGAATTSAPGIVQPDGTSITISNGVISAVGGSGSGVSYSTTEQVIGTWIDGKPLYQKTINFGALPDTTIKQVSIDIANFKRVWIYDGYAYNSTNGVVNLLSLINPPNGIASSWAFYIIGDKIECVTGSDRTAYTECYVTVRYTKTTD